MEDRSPDTKTQTPSGQNPSGKPSLKRNYFYNFIGQILTLIIPLATTPYLSRVLHEEGNGQISFASSIITIFLIFATFGFDGYGQREIAKCRNDIDKKSKTFWELVIMRIVTTGLSAIVLFSILFSVGFTKANDLILLFSIQLVGNAFDIQFFFRGEEDFKSIAIRTIILKIAGLICIFAFVKNENDEGIYALCISISTVLSNIILWPSILHKIKKVNFRTLQFKKHIIPSFAIFIPALATTIFSIMDKTEIGWFAENSDYENGCYEQAYKINQVALVLVIVISPILAPRNAYDYQRGDITSLKSHLQFFFQYIWLFGTPLIVGFSVMSPSLSAWFLGSGYEKVPLLLQIMSVRFIVSGFGECLGTDLFIPIGKEKYNTIATCIGAVVNIVSNYFFIRLWGATGAAITTSISEIVVTSILLIFAFNKGYVNLKMLFSGAWQYIIGSGVMFVVIFFMNKYMPYTIWYFILITLSGSFVYFLVLLCFKNQLLFTFLSKALSKFQRKKPTELS